MKLNIIFVGRAEPLAALYEGVGATSFMVRPLVQTDPPIFALPQTGDVVTLRMHPGPDIRSFRCIRRHFDFSRVEEPLLQIELDMP